MGITQLYCLAALPRSEQYDIIEMVMKQLKRVVAVLGVAFGSLALFYIFFARQLTLKNCGLSVEAQLIAQRIITPLLFVALGALAVS